MSKTALGLGIESVNQQNLAIAEGKATAIIDKIVRLKEAIDKSAANVVSYQGELAKLTVPCISESTVLGFRLPPASDRNENEKTIGSVIEKLVKSRLGCVDERATRLTSSIAGEQSSIESAQTKIIELRKELAEIKVEVLVESDIAGD